VKLPFKRKRYLVLPFQYRLLAVNMVYFLSAFLVFAAVLFVPVMIELNAPLSDERTSRMAEQFLSLHARVWPAAAILFALLVVHSVLVSHRIAGPLYRFRKFYEAITRGDLRGPVTIRKHDYLHDDARAFSAMLASLSERIASLKARHDSLQGALGRLKALARGDSATDIHRYLCLIESEVECLRADIERFKTGDELNEGREIPMFSGGGPRA
jgi:methyl-accepting chemotaxis protein